MTTQPKTLELTLIRSPAGRIRHQKTAVRKLGLFSVGSTSRVEMSDEVNRLVSKVRRLLSVSGEKPIASSYNSVPRTLPAFDVSTQVNHSPHVVILGAGASRAAFPKGDANGNRLPLMYDFVEVTGLDTMLSEAQQVDANRDFESFFTQLYESGSPSEVKAIEQHVHQYFAKLVMPAEPTIYDYLLLSLREKDVIATFNWDPFLFHAVRRSLNVERLPQLYFLHGNTAVGICRHDRVKGFVDQSCSRCGEPLDPTRLLGVTPF